MNRALVALALASCSGKSTTVERVAAKGAPIEITVGAPGFSAAEVESGVTSVIESAVSDIPGVEHIRSASDNGRARITVELAAGADQAATNDAVKSRISSVLRMLPSSIYAPAIQLGWRTDSAGLRYTLSGPFTLALLRETAAHRLAAAIATTDGVAGIDICGGADPSLMIYVDPAQLAGVNMTVSELEAALKPALAAPMNDLAAFHEVMIAQRGGATVRLSDVATISEDAAPSRCNAVDEHADAAIEGVVYAQSGADPAAVRIGALAAIDKVHAMLPPGMVLDVMPEDKPAALLGLTEPDFTPAARVDQLRKVRDSLLAAGAQRVVLAEGVRDPMTGLGETDIEMRFWPASVEQAAVVRLEEVQGLVVARADAKIIAIRGPELATLRDLAGRLADRLKSGGVAALGRVGDSGEPRLEIRVDRAAAADLGVPVQAITDTFTFAMGGADLGQATIAGTREPVMLTTKPSNYNGGGSLQRFDGLMVRAAAGPSGIRGVAIPLSQVAVFSQELEPATIYHVDRERWVGVRISGDAVDVARKVIAAFATPPGYRIELE